MIKENTRSDDIQVAGHFANKLCKIYFFLYLAMVVIVLVLAFGGGYRSLLWQHMPLITGLSWRGQLPLIHFIASILLVYLVLAYITSSVGILTARYKSLRFKYALAIITPILTIFFVWVLNAYYYPGSRLSWLWLRNFSIWSHHIWVYIAYAWLFFLFTCTLVAFYLRYQLLRFLFFSCALSFLLLFANTGMAWSIKSWFSRYHARPSQPNVVMMVFCSWNIPIAKLLAKHVTEFTKESIWFPNAYTPTARSMVANMSMLRGQYPLTMKQPFNLMMNSKQQLARQLLPYDLNKLGYGTWALSSGTQFKPMDNQLTWGFQHRFQPNAYLYNFVLTKALDFPWANLWVNFPMSHFLFPYAYAMIDDHLHYYPSSFNRRINDVAHRISTYDEPFFLYIVNAGVHYPFMDAQLQTNTLADNYKKLIIDADLLPLPAKCRQTSISLRF